MIPKLKFNGFVCYTIKYAVAFAYCILIGLMDRIIKMKITNFITKSKFGKSNQMLKKPLELNNQKFNDCITTGIFSG